MNRPQVIVESSGIVQTLKLKRDKKHQTFAVFSISLEDGSYKCCLAWESQCQGAELIQAGNKIHVSGFEQQYGSYSASLVCKQVNPIFPQWENIEWKNQGRMILFISLLQDRFLQQMLKDMMNDEMIWPRWKAIPASRQYHHAQQGGLLRHSLDSAYLVLSNPFMENTAIKEIAAIGSLLHDIGKIRTHDNDGHLTELGQELDHELLTLEIISSHLERLENNTWSAANQLRRLLTYKRRDKKNKLLSIDEEFVGFSDRVSVMSERYRMIEV